MRFYLIGFVLLVSLALMAQAPATQSLVLVSRDGRVSERSLQMLRRVLKDVEIARKSEKVYYAENPQLPQPVCAHELRFFLFDASRALTAFGCFNEHYPQPAVELMRQRFYDKDWLDAVLAQAAAGRYPQARALLEQNKDKPLDAGRRRQFEKIRDTLSRLN